MEIPPPGTLQVTMAGGRRHSISCSGLELTHIISTHMPLVKAKVHCKGLERYKSALSFEGETEILLSSITYHYRQILPTHLILNFLQNSQSLKCYNEKYICQDKKL